MQLFHSILQEFVLLLHNWKQYSVLVNLLIDDCASASSGKKHLEMFRSLILKVPSLQFKTQYSPSIFFPSSEHLIHLLSDEVLTFLVYKA